ncbi:MAG: HAD family phosphatase [Clostridium sp.]|uniref:HAD family hydrolase n=1 Tax=Clostridium sp. TaxID=1506 RepID=UPI002A87CCD7|nr:HAD family phosphatase [Clostridium sp.]MDY5098453.1 HAD family phosphatase [Clostridium sp.]
MNDIKLVIFDMDGLMIDTERLNLKGWIEIGKKHNYTIGPENIQKIMGMARHEHEPILRKDFGDDFPYDTIYNEKNQYVTDIIEKEGIGVKPFLLELLDVLDDMKIKKVVATGTSRERAIYLLKRAGLYGRFDDMVCGDEVKNGKPNPEIFLTACQIANISPAEAMVLEDSQNGLIAAHDAGIKCFIVPDLQYPASQYTSYAEKICETLKDAIDYIKK